MKETIKQQPQGPKRQHFIPRAYLKNFAHTIDEDKAFISAYNKQTKEFKDSISTKDICLETDLYTLKNLQGRERYGIETFFSENIDSKYSQVYKILIEEKKTSITKDEKLLILFTTLSLYFRTPKILNTFIEFMNNILLQAQKTKPEDEIYFLGVMISLKAKDFKSILKEIREHHRIDYIRIQLALLGQFVEYKFSDGLSVIELYGDQEFITSDNPVEIYDHGNTSSSIFNENDSIYIPLNTKHALFIAPKRDSIHPYSVYYKRDSLAMHLTMNHSVYDNSERWIIGTRVGINAFLTTKDKYRAPYDPASGFGIIDKLKIKSQSTITINHLITKGISNNNTELIDYLKSIKGSDMYNENIEFQDLFEKLRDMGLSI